MKAKQQCPKCGSVNLWYVNQVAANEKTGFLQLHPPFQLAVTGNGSGGREGRLEAYACQQCGLVEFYLKEPLRADGTHVIPIQRSANLPHR